MKRFNSSKWITENKHGKILTEGMSPEEWADAKEKERLNQHPEKDKINKIKQMMDKEKPQKEDYKPSHRAYNVIDKSNNDEIVAKELPRHKALELAKTNKDYMIDATDRLAETDAIATARSIRPSGEKDEEQDEYDKGWYGESLKEAASKLGYLNEAEYGKYFGGRTKGGDKEVDGMEDGEQTNQYNKAEFMYVEGNGSFYALNLYTGDGQKQKMKYDEANEWLKGQLEYIHEGDLIPRKHNSGLEDLDLIVDRLRELGIEASHNEYDFS